MASHTHLASLRSLRSCSLAQAHLLKPIAHSRISNVAPSRAPKMRRLTSHVCPSHVYQLKCRTDAEKSGGHTNSAALLGLITHHPSRITIFSHIAHSRAAPIPHKKTRRITSTHFYRLSLRQRSFILFQPFLYFLRIIFYDFRNLIGGPSLFR